MNSSPCSRGPLQQGTMQTDESRTARCRRDGDGWGRADRSQLDPSGKPSAPVLQRHWRAIAVGITFRARAADAATGVVGILHRQRRILGSLPCAVPHRQRRGRAPTAPATAVGRDVMQQQKKNVFVRSKHNRCARSAGSCARSKPFRGGCMERRLKRLRTNLLHHQLRLRR